MQTNIFKQKPTYKQMYVLIFLSGIITGSILFIWKNDIFFPTMSLYHELNSSKLTFDAINYHDLLKHILDKRFYDLLILFLTQITIFKRPSAYIYSFIYGFSAALLEAFYVQQYSLLGIPLFIITLFPHFLFYALAWHKICTNDIFSSKLTNVSLLNALKVITFFLLFALAGIICESSLNLLLLKYVFKSLL